MAPSAALPRNPGNATPGHQSRSRPNVGTTPSPWHSVSPLPLRAKRGSARPEVARIGVELR
jgi:hypothetical protein